MRLGIVGQQRDMRSPEHDRDSPLAKTIGQFIGPRGGTGNDRQSDEVGLNAQIDVFDAMSAKADQLVTEVQGDAADAQRAAADTATTGRSVMLGLGLGAVVLAIGLAVFMTRSLTRAGSP